MSTSSVIGSMQSALDCAGKCDCCDKLQSQINDLKAQLARIPQIDESRIVRTTRSALQPDINTAVAGGVVLVTNKLQPQIQNSFDKAREALEKAFSAKNTAESAVSDAANAAREAGAARAEAVTASRKAVSAQSTANEASSIAGTAKGKANTAFDKAGYAEQKAELSAKQAEAARIKANSAEDIARIAGRESELAKGLANQANGKATSAIGKAAEASSEALKASSSVTGLKGIVEGVKSRVGQLGELISKVERTAGDAIVKAAEAIGISKSALSATARLAGRIVEIFNVIATIFTLIEQLETLRILGDRIDAVEAGLVALGNSVSGILGKLLGLQNRIKRNESSISEVRVIALDAKGIGEAANLKAGQAIESVAGVRVIAVRADSKASQAQTTADGAVRNASRANENATTAYQKATEAQGIGEQAKRVAQDALGKAGVALTTALTAIALYQTVKGLRGLQGIPGIPGRQGERGLQGIQGVPGRDGITTVVQVPGVPGRNGRNGVNGLPGRNGRNGIDVNPADVASLRALIVQQHAATRANINGTSTGLVNGVKAFFTTQLAGLTALITAIANNTYVEKALAVLTFAATIHNALMLSNNLAQTLGTIIDQVLGFILPKGLDGNPISIGNVLGKVAHEVIADTVGEANYQHISEDWAKANRIYQASVNVFNQIGNAVGLVTAGMEVIGGNVAKIGNALKVWGAIGEKAYSWMNPQPNFKGKFFNFINTATAEANTIAMMVAIPIGISAAAIEINSSVGAVKKELDQEDPKDKDGHPITDALGNPLKWEPGVTVPDPTKTVLAQEQAKADSRNIIEATLEDLFDGGD